MKRTIAFILMVLLLPWVLRSQELPKQKQLSPEHFQIKSKQLRNTGFELLGGGVVLGVVGAAVFMNNFELYGSSNSSGENVGGLLFVAGSAAILTSGGFFIASAVNHGKAKGTMVGMKMEQWAPYGMGKAGSSAYPAVSFRLPLH
jgi:hypothetical protein